MSDLVSIVVPVFNEEENLAELHRRVAAVFADADHAIEFVFVDDGSHDRSVEIIRDLARQDPRVHGVLLSRNFGHEAAIEAGMRDARGDAAIVMDADLQDSPEALPELVRRWRSGVDVAYVVRKDRKEGLLQRAAFSAFYRLAHRTMSIDLPRDAGPFCLVGRPALDAINEMGERGRYFPGLRAFAGFRQEAVEVERKARHAGATKYSFVGRSMGAFNAIFSFSKIPLRLASLAGFISAGLALLGAAWVVVGGLTSDQNAPGWVSLMAVVLLLSGVQLVTIGIVGEYLGKVYDEVRHRPTFIVREVVGADGPETPPGRDRAADDSASAGPGGVQDPVIVQSETKSETGR